MVIGDFVDVVIGGFVDVVIGDFVDVVICDFVDVVIGDFVDVVIGDFVDFVIGDFVDVVIGDFVDFVIGDFVDVVIGDFVDVVIGMGVVGIILFSQEPYHSMRRDVNFPGMLFSVCSIRMVHSPLGSSFQKKSDINAQSEKTLAPLSLGRRLSNGDRVPDGDTSSISTPPRGYDSSVTYNLTCSSLETQFG